MLTILLRIGTDQAVEGWGESDRYPYVTGETFGGAYASLCHVLLPCLEGLTVFDTAQLHQRMDRTLRGNPSIKAAVDIAVYDALATAVDLPLFRVLGGQAHSELTQ